MRDRIWVCDDLPSTRFPVWTRGNAGEVFVEAVSPLTWSSFGRKAWEPGWRDAFCDMGAFTAEDFRPAGEVEILACFGGYIYINMSVSRVLAVRIPGLTVEAMDRSLFGDYAGAPPYRPDPRDANAERSTAVVAWLQSLFTVDPKPATEADRRRLDALLAQRPDLAGLSDTQVLAYFRSLMPEARWQFRRHVMNSFGANVLASVIAQMAQAAGASDLAAKVTTAIGDIDSATQSFEVWELSRQVRSSSAVTAAFDQGIEGLVGRLRAAAEPEAKAFLAQWDAFIDHWGFTGPSVWEFRSPTYANDPDMPLRMLERARHAPDSSAPGLRAAALIEERENAIVEISSRLAGNPEAQGQFLAGARGAANYFAARERSKLVSTRLNNEARTAMRELGQRLVRRGLLSRWEDVLLVTDEEADALVANPAAHTGLIAERAKKLAMLRAKEPPFVFEGEPPPLSAFKDRGYEVIENAGAGTRLTGIGVSPGRYTGRARLITSVNVDTTLEPGEIIVAVTTDSAWGPLFLAAGAVVVETGAMISHAAIVSRELGIPAVVSVAGATQRIKDGASITVDGDAGAVTMN
jgi:phosphohistidine swiveling domain-containing protein